MKKLFLFVFVFVVFSGLQFSFAQTGPALTVDQMDICTGIENRVPVGPDTIFADTVGRLYCYTKISGAADTTSIYHVWYLKDEEKARVKLALKGDPWRTWSSKIIPKEWDGKWRVDVVDEAGSVLKSEAFMVKASQ